jgi:hypothetical protein
MRNPHDHTGWQASVGGQRDRIGLQQDVARGGGRERRRRVMTGLRAALSCAWRSSRLLGLDG